TPAVRGVARVTSPPGAGSDPPPARLARFDIVGFDPRGVGGSQPALNCMTGPQLDTFFATDDETSTAGQIASVIAQSKLFTAECQRNSADLLPYVGTPSAARDM